MNKDFDSYNDWLVMDDEVVDISKSGAAAASVEKTKKKKEKKEKKPKAAERYMPAYTEEKPKSKDKKSKKKLAIIIASVAAAVVVAGGVAGFCLLNTDSENGVGIFSEPKEFTFEEGITVSGVSIAGKTMDEARSLLEANSSSFIDPVKITIAANGETYELTQADFTYTYNIDEVLNRIKSDIDNGVTDQTAGTAGTTAALNYEVTATVVEDSVQENVKKLEEKTNKDAVNAKVSKFTPFAESRFEYSEASVGCKLNTDDLFEQINDTFSQSLSEASITADVQEVQAKITVDDIKKNVVELARYETVSYNNANGTSNMKVSLEACNGSVIEPGATWSFNECTGDSNLESNGYKPAQVISEGTLTDGVGGGICQSSSTIYNAAIRANMKIEERYNHKWASSYVPTGLDATIDYPRLDLKLSNPTDYQMFMECKLDGKTLIVSIWGVKSDSYDTITCTNEITERGGSTYKVKAWRIYLKDGEEVDREALYSSSYGTENGYIFKSAENDPNVKSVNSASTSDDDNESSSSQTSSDSSSSRASSSSKPSSSSRASSSSKPSSSSSKPSSSSSKPSSSSSKPASSSSATEAPTQKPAESGTSTPSTSAAGDAQTEQETE